jgi:hypothetical protein
VALLARLCAPSPAGTLDIRFEPSAERPGIFLAQINLILNAIEREPYCLGGGASIEIVLQYDRYLLCHPDLRNCDGLSAPYRSQHAA